VNGVENLKTTELMCVMKGVKDASLSLQMALFNESTKFQREIFAHPPYSPDLAPSDFHLFPELKKWLGRQCFQINEERQDNVETYFNSSAATFY